jgi:acyl dehydratase
MTEKKVLYFKDIEIGREFKPLIYKLTEETILKYCKAVGEEGKIFLDASVAKKEGYSALAAPPTTAAMYALKGFLEEVEMPPGGIHASQVFDFVQPAVAGDELTTTSKVADKYETRGRKFVIIESETKNQNGQEIVRSKMTAVWPE